MRVTQIAGDEDKYPTVQLSNGEYINLGFLIGKPIIVAEDTQIYECPTCQALGVVKKGASLGELYYFIDYTSHIWLTFISKQKKPFLVFYKTSLIDVKGMKQIPGVLTTKETKDKIDQENASTTDKILESVSTFFKDYGKYAIGLAVFKLWLDNRNKSKS